MEAFYKTSNYALIRQSDMLAEMKEEALDICTVAIEKHSSDLEKATQVIKETLDKKFGGPWHVVAGANFSYEITHECRSLLYLMIGGRIGVLTWKL